MVLCVSLCVALFVGGVSHDLRRTPSRGVLPSKAPVEFRRKNGGFGCEPASGRNGKKDLVPVKKLALSELKRLKTQKRLFAALSINRFTVSDDDGCARTTRYLKNDATCINVEK